MINKLLHKNISKARIAAFAISNLIGMAIMAVGLQFFLDARSIWSRPDSFLSSDFLAVNKKISGPFSKQSTLFTPEEIADIERQPWVKRLGAFESANFRIYASMGLDTLGDSGRNISTAMFFEAVPDEFIDLRDSGFSYTPGAEEIPMVISKDYLAMYNFGFAGAAGLPQLSEQVVSGIPLRLTLTDDNGNNRRHFFGRIVGYSNRFNTILVPRDFLTLMNAEYSSAPGARSAKPSGDTPSVGRISSASSVTPENPSRIIIDVNSPGDTRIAEYLEAHGLELAGDKSQSSAAYLLKVIAAIVISIGGIITLLSLLIILLSMSLLMEKNRTKIHSLLMLGYTIPAVSRPFRRIVALTEGITAILTAAILLGVRAYYLPSLVALGATPATVAWSLGLIAAMALLITRLNFAAIRRSTFSAWR